MGSTKQANSKILRVAVNGDSCVRLIDFSSRRPVVLDKKASKKARDGDALREMKIDSTLTTLSNWQNKLLFSATDDELRSAFLDFLSADQMLENQDDFVLVLLCSMLGRIAQIAASQLPSLPIIHLEKLSAVPASLELLIYLAGGPERLKGKHRSRKWKTTQPRVLSVHVPTGSAALSKNMEDYSFIKIKWRGKKVKFAIPFCNRSVVIAPNFTRSLSKQVISDSPFLIPICCGLCPSQTERVIFKLNGHAFNVTDEEYFDLLNSKSELIAAILDYFFQKFQTNHKMQDAWAGYISEFIPRLKHGRFHQKITTSETLILSAALALWKSFLTFYSEDCTWISPSEAHDSLLTFWRKVLPESAPPKKGVTSSSAKLEDAASFFSFLQEYCQTYREQILSYDEPWNPNAVGMLRKLPNQSDTLLIFPREKLFDAYLAFIQTRGGDVSGFDGSDSKWQTKLHRILADSLDFIKTEGRDTTWRYRYYPKDVTKTKTPCIAIALNALPNDVTADDSVFGQMIGAQMPADPDDCIPNLKIGPDLSENTVKAGVFL